MKIFRISSLYITIYLLFICLFFAIAYRKTQVNFHTIGNLNVKERAFAPRPLFPKTLKSVDIDFKGISFNISGKKPVTLLAEDGLTRKSGLLGINKTVDSLEVYLENNIMLQFVIDNGGERLTINSSIPDDAYPKIVEVQIPLEIKSSHTMETTDLSYKIYNESDEFHLKLNDNYEISSSNDYIKLIAENKKLSTLTFSHLNARDLPIAEEWYMKHRTTKGIKLESLIANYNSYVEEAINKKYSAIRYYPSGSTWAKPPTRWENVPDPRNIDENSSVIYLANSVDKTDYIKNYFKIYGLKKLYPGKFSTKSSPYLGNIVKNGDKLISNFQRELAEIKGAINNNEKSILNTRIKDDYFMNNNINLSRLESIVVKTSKGELTLEQLSISLDHLLKLEKYGFYSKEVSDNIKDITSLIIQKIYWNGSKLYLTENNSESDMLLNLETGLLLAEASQYEISEYARPIGESLVDTFFSSKDTNGDVPAKYDIGSNSYSEEVIPGSDIYLKLAENANTPHFYQDKDLLVYTISNVDSQSVNVNSTTSEVRINVEYPFTKNSNPHSFVISGIDSMKQIYLGGRLWRPDINFEKWYIGYYYDQNSKLLYFMINSRSKEDIRITK